MTNVERMRLAAQNKPAPKPPQPPPKGKGKPHHKGKGGPKKPNKGKAPAVRDKLFEKFRLPECTIVLNYDASGKRWMGHLTVLDGPTFSGNAEGAHRLVHELGQMWKKSQQPKPEEPKKEGVK